MIMIIVCATAINGHAKVVLHARSMLRGGIEEMSLKSWESIFVIRLCLMVLWWDRLCNHTRWTHLIINSALFIIKCVHCSDNSDFKSNGGWWRLRWYKFDDDFDDCGIGDVYHRSQVSVGRMGGSVINPRVFCIVRSLLMWSLCPYTISNFHIFTLMVSNSFLTPSDICIWVLSSS